MTKHWWKILAAVLLIYTCITGFLMEVPSLNILNQTIRNLHFHVPMWFGMIVLTFVSMVYSIIYLRKEDIKYDLAAKSYAKIGLVFGVLGILTGMIWAKYTWGAYWSWDTKQNTSAICLLIYLAYFVLRGSVEEQQKQARISAVYNIFAFASLIPLMFVLPRLTDSLHPGMGGNPAFNQYDMDNNLRMVFYPAVIGFILLGNWMSQIAFRIEKVQEDI